MQDCSFIINFHNYLDMYDRRVVSKSAASFEDDKPATSKAFNQLINSATTAGYALCEKILLMMNNYGR